MKVLALVPALFDTSPGQRFRIEQWSRHWPANAVELTIAPFEDAALHATLYQPGRTLTKARLLVQGLLRRFGLALRSGCFDLVYLFREAALLGPALVERLIAWRRIPIVFDFDDAVWVPYVSPSNKYFSYLKCFGKTATLCRISAHVLAGNPYLAEYARQHNANVSIVPTTIDTDLYQLPFAAPQRSNEAPVVIGWTGSYSTVQHLDTLRPVLSELKVRVPYKLSVVGTPQYELPGVKVDARAWKADTEVADLARFDIGIMPLPDDNWSKGKCGLKLLQCMALGIPVIGGRVGVNGDIIDDGVNGFLASSELEWTEKLTRLIEDPALRRTLGQRGQETVDQRYSAKIWAPRVQAIFDSVLRGERAETSSA
jgi:glycosyltransferase involved in cell wall biosynthesis